VAIISSLIWIYFYLIIVSAKIIYNHSLVAYLVLTRRLSSPIRSV